jgi:hypothetical protein
MPRQLYLAAGIPPASNGIMFMLVSTILMNHINTRFDTLKHPGERQ